MSLDLTEGNRPIDFEEAKRLGQEAKQKLQEFYITQQVDPEIAQEASSGMLGEPLAGLTSGFLHHVKVDPNLRELQDEFSGLVQDGFNPSATAILLTDGSFRFAHWQEEERPFFSGNYRTQFQEVEKRGKAMGRKYRELLKEGKESVVAAKAIVENARRYYENLWRLEKTTGEEREGIKTQLIKFEEWLNFEGQYRFRRRIGVF